MKIRSWLKVARSESLKSTYKHQLGAVIVSGGSIISKGFNQIRHSSKLKEHAKVDETLHAERDAIIKIKNKKKLFGSTIYIYREHKNGNPANAKPCIFCHEMIKASGIKKAIYTIETFPYYEEVKF